MYSPLPPARAIAKRRAVTTRPLRVIHVMAIANLNPALSAVAPIASEPLRRSDWSRCATSGHGRPWYHEPTLNVSVS
jgi:hypothetical protein